MISAHGLSIYTRADIERRVGGGASTIVISPNLTFSMCGAASLCANQQTLANCVLANRAAQGEPRIERDRPRVEFHSTAAFFRIIFQPLIDLKSMCAHIVISLRDF
jgi:hypothetical protein